MTTISVYAELSAEIGVRATRLEPVEAPAVVRFRVALGEREPVGDLDFAPPHELLDPCSYSPLAEIGQVMRLHIAFPSRKTA